jgi:regulation of enolase protein 1 (concanavalin A-like superfamily)
MNLLQNLTPDQLTARKLSWDHPPLGWNLLPGGSGLRMTVPATVDYFQDPAGMVQKDDAPYLFLQVSGDFVAQAHVRPTFTTTYDAGTLFVRHDALHWAKIAYEKTDFGTTAAVSVVTNGVSDDANSVDCTAPDLWLQVCRAGNVFGLHYALDGIHWRMVRLFNLPVPALVSIGIMAQSPVGPGTQVDFLNFSVESRTVKNLRAGI